jgi:hypothetical protein
MKPLTVTMNNDGYLIEFAYTSSFLPKQTEKMNLPYKADWDGSMMTRIDWVSRRVAGHLRDEYSIEKAKKAILAMIAEKQNQSSSPTDEA